MIKGREGKEGLRWVAPSAVDAGLIERVAKLNLIFYFVRSNKFFFLEGEISY